MSVEQLAQVNSLDLLPGNLPKFDEPTRAALAALILDETIELPSSERGNQIMYQKLPDGEFIKLYQPLVDILTLDPDSDRPPLREHFNRASKLGLVPSVSPIYSRMSLSEIHAGLGFRAKFRFNDWSQKDFVEAGQRLARLTGGRPSRDIITEAGRGNIMHLGVFPTIDNLKARFGKLSVFHELIGYPSCKGWTNDDYLDWAAAFYRQNPGQQLSARIIDGFSALGRGPSKQPIIKHFGGIEKFKELSAQTFQYAIQDETIDRQMRFDQATDLAMHDNELLQIVAEFAEEPERILQVVAQYRLAKQLATTALQSEIKNAAVIKSADYFAWWLINFTDGRVTGGSLESWASTLGIFDDLWPMYRFQNVDLKLPDLANQQN